MAGVGNIEMTDKEVFGALHIKVRHRQQPWYRFRFWAAWTLIFMASRISPCNFVWEVEHPTDA